jgi:hypothetical protein
VPGSNGGGGAAAPRRLGNEETCRSRGFGGLTTQSSRASQSPSHDRDCTHSAEFEQQLHAVTKCALAVRIVTGAVALKGHPRRCLAGTVPRSAVLPRKRASEARLQRSSLIDVPSLAAPALCSPQKPLRLFALFAPLRRGRHPRPSLQCRRCAATHHNPSNTLSPKIFPTFPPSCLPVASPPLTAIRLHTAPSPFRLPKPPYPLRRRRM